MRCPKCGFESAETRCPECGEELSEENRLRQCIREMLGAVLLGESHDVVKAIARRALGEAE